MNVQAARCRHHPHREAVARCPDCGRFFCRECIAEEGERVLCAACLAARGADRAQRRRIPAALLATASGLTGMLLLWGIFYYLGKGLLLLPSAFHDGTFWNRF